MLDKKLYDERVKKLKALLADTSRKNLIIFGGVGVGKTYLVKDVLKDYYFIDEPTFKVELSSGNIKLRGQDEWSCAIDKYILECLAKKKDIIYDDFGSSGITEAYIEKMLYWINERTKKGYRTIRTTNLSQQAFKQIEPRMYSRMGLDSYFVLLEGEDLRKNNVKFIKL